MQRHHLLPCQLRKLACFSGMFSALEEAGLAFDDFRANGLLLPATEGAALRSGLPLHRGPHREYNELVGQRVGRIEAAWASKAPRYATTARFEAIAQLALLQRALRQKLQQREARALVLNRKDPFRHDVDFAELDALAEQLWAATS